MLVFRQVCTDNDLPNLPQSLGYKLATVWCPDRLLTGLLKELFFLVKPDFTTIMSLCNCLSQRKFEIIENAGNSAITVHGYIA